MKRFYIYIAIGLFLASCNPVATSNPLPTSKPSAQVVPALTATVFASATVEPTPTQYNPNANEKGCGKFIATIPINGKESLSQEEIAQKLFGVYLEHYKSPDLGERCRLESFKTVNTKSDQRIAFLAGEQKVDYVTWVMFFVKIPNTDVTSGWARAMVKSNPMVG